MTPWGIEPATFVAQCLNQLRLRMPYYFNGLYLITSLYAFLVTWWRLFHWSRNM